jgi:hypothetical protein
VKKNWLVGIFLALILVLVSGVPLSAGGLTVFSGKIETSIDSGRDYTYTMNVQNSSDLPMDISAESKGYGTALDNPFVVLEPEDDLSQFTAREVLTISPNNFHLGPGESRGITVSAKLPPGTGAGGRYAIVYIRTLSKGIEVETVSAIAARVLLTLDGSKLTHAGEITGVELNAGESLEALINVTNTGNHHYKPHVLAKLRAGDRVLAWASLDDVWPMIPQYSRQFNLNFAGQELLPAGEYEVDIEVRDESEALLAQQTARLRTDSPYLLPTLTSDTVSRTPAITPAPPPVSITLDLSGEATLAMEQDAVSISSELPANWLLPIGIGVLAILVIFGILFLIMKRTRYR